MSGPAPSIGGVDAAASSSPLPGLVSADSSQHPTNSFVGPLLTDMYQLTMAYAYFKANKHKDQSTFDMFFRKPPFGGEYAIFAGLEEVLRFVQSYRFSEKEIAYLKKTMAIAPEDVEPFFDGYLGQLDCSEVKIYAVAEGTVVFPRIPLLRIEGPLGICQLLETTLLNLCNFATLVCTNAARHRLAAGHDKTLLEFGLRRAQGPDGAMSASRYSAIGGFDGTSNVMAGMAHGLTVKGTHAHALVSAFVGLEELPSRLLDGHDIVELALAFRKELGFTLSSLGELAAFISFAQAFPNNFLALVDTYDTLASGVPNFLCVALALNKIGRKAVGIRLDSGDLAYLSRETRKLFRAVDGKYGTDFARGCSIVASNDINESVLLSLNEQKHDIDVFGIGTNLVTCQAQPALGMVYKLVEVNSVPRIKLSQEASKITLPSRKEAYRLIGVEGVPLLDLLIRAGEPRPQPGKRILCRHPFDEKKRAYVTPSAVIPLLRLVWKGGKASLDERLATDDSFLLTLNTALGDASSVASGSGEESIAAADGPADVSGVRSRASTLASTTGVDSSIVPPPSPRSVSLAKPHLPRGVSGLIPIPQPGPLSGSLGSRSTSGTGGAFASGAGGAGSSSPASPGGDAAAGGLALPPPASGADASSGNTGYSRAMILSPSALPAGVNLRAPFPTLTELKEFVSAQLSLIREDHLRSVNPTPYKISVSTELYHFTQDLMLREIPIAELE